jgi:CheY-like chemotaxis protein
VEKPPVLLVDDNEATCTLIRAVLGPEFTVDAVSDGNAAIEKLKSLQYSAILLDLLMPVTSGYVVLDFLRAERPDLLPRVLVVTAALTAHEMNRIASYPVAGVISKPFEVDVLMDSVRRVATADPHDTPFGGSFLSSSMLLLLASVLEKRWM